LPLFYWKWLNAAGNCRQTEALAASSSQQAPFRLAIARPRASFDALWQPQRIAIDR
jgi:hypothetical protein